MTMDAALESLLVAAKGLARSKVTDLSRTSGHENHAGASEPWPKPWS